MNNGHRKPRWYHWTLLSLCSVGMSIMGVADLLWGAATDSRFYAIDDAAVRVLGACLVLFSISLFFRRSWAFVGFCLVQALFFLELVLTHDFRSDSAIGIAVQFVLVVVFIAIPTALVVWLRSVMAAGPTQVFGEKQKA